MPVGSGASILLCDIASFIQIQFSGSTVVLIIITLSLIVVTVYLRKALGKHPCTVP